MTITKVKICSVIAARGCDRCRGVTVKNTQGATPKNATLRADEYCILARCAMLKGRNFFKMVFDLAHLSHTLRDSENSGTGVWQV